MIKKMTKREKGITLIALVITIIVLLILAGVSIAMLAGDNGIMTQAKAAKISTMLSTYKEELELYKTEKRTENTNFLDSSLNAGKNSLLYNTQKENEKGNIKTVITQLDEEYIEKIEIIKGELLINTKNKQELEIARGLGIKVNPYEIINGELTSSDGNLLLVDNNGTLTIPDSVTKIGEGAFANVSGLKTIIIPGTVKEICNKAFSNNATLEKVIIKDGVEKIGDEAFRECMKLKEINLPDSINYIGPLGFYYCTNLKEITIPPKVENIQIYTFCR